MKYDFIQDSVLDNTPELLKELDPNQTYSLEKTGSKRPNMYVNEGDRQVGKLRIVDVADMGKPGVLVTTSFSDFMRTSPVLLVKRVSETTLELETEGGFYRLKDVTDLKGPF